MTFEQLTENQQVRLQALWGLGEGQGFMTPNSREEYEFDELSKHTQEGHNCTEQCKKDLEKMQHNASYMFSGEDL